MLSMKLFNTPFNHGSMHTQKQVWVAQRVLSLIRLNSSQVNIHKYPARVPVGFTLLHCLFIQLIEIIRVQSQLDAIQPRCFMINKSSIQLNITNVVYKE